MQSAIYIQPQQNNAACCCRAHYLALELQLPLCLQSGAGRPGYFLLVQAQRLGLCTAAQLTDIKGALWPDLLRLDVSSGPGRSAGQPLYKAILGRSGRRSKRLLVLDATAGLGQDAWLLAVRGAQVLALERNVAVFALLRDNLARAGVQKPRVARRIKPCHMEAGQYLSRVLEDQGRPCRAQPVPDVIYLDPLFAKHKRKAAPNKAIQLLQQLTYPDRQSQAEEDQLLKLALELARQRVVVKRPLQGPVLGSGSAQPDLQIEAKSLRYDVYLA